MKKKQIVSKELYTNKRNIILYCCVGVCIIFIFIITLVEKKMQINMGWLKTILKIIGGGTLIFLLISLSVETFRMAKNFHKDKDKGISRKIE